MSHWPDAPDWQALRAQVQPAVDALCARITHDALSVVPLSVEAAPIDAVPLVVRTPKGARLSGAALGPAVLLPQDTWLAELGLPLDRWRRTIAALTEAAVLHALDARHGVPDTPWDRTLRIGQAAHLVDTADPHLGHAWAPAVRLLQSPERSLHDQPRGALFWRRFTQETGPPSEARWHAFVQHVRDRAKGPASTLPVAVPPAQPTDFSRSLQLAPLSARPVRRTLRTAGRAWSVDGPGLPERLHPQDGVDTVIFSSVAGGVLALSRDQKGPLGAWRLDSGGMGNHFGAARGVTLTLSASGKATLTAADGFVGPTTRGVLDMADQYGVSGSADGSWRLVSIDEDARSGRLRVQGLHAGMATVHGRGGGGFALPAEEWLEPARHFLRMLETVPLNWTLLENGRQLRIQARTLNGLELRLSRETT